MTAAIMIGMLAWAEIALRRFSAFDLARVPINAPAYPAQLVRDVAHARASSIHGVGSAPLQWRRYRFRRMSMLIPDGLVRRQSVGSAPDVLILTDRRQTLWVSVTLTRSETAWTPAWYRFCLHARRNPIGLMGKALIIPPLGTRTPGLIAQTLGPWQAYLYVTPKRMAADLFADGYHVTAVLAARRDGLLTVEIARRLLASIRVREG